MQIFGGAQIVLAAGSTFTKTGTVRVGSTEVYAIQSGRRLCRTSGFGYEYPGRYVGCGGYNNSRMPAIQCGKRNLIPNECGGNNCRCHCDVDVHANGLLRRIRKSFLRSRRDT